MIKDQIIAESSDPIDKLARAIGNNIELNTRANIIGAAELVGIPPEMFQQYLFGILFIAAQVEAYFRSHGVTHSMSPETYARQSLTALGEDLVGTIQDDPRFAAIGATQ